MSGSLLPTRRDGNDHGEARTKSNSNDTRMLDSTKSILGLDKKGNQRALFLYDGGWGVWKFLVGFIIERDSLDHFRFSPVQTNLAKNLCEAYGMPSDVSTAVLLTEECAYIESDSILYMLYPYLSFPYYILGFLALFLVPKLIRDFGYRIFARHRGQIWILFKKLTRMGDTTMYQYRDNVLGLEHEKILQPSWGFDPWVHFWLILLWDNVTKLEWHPCSFWQYELGFLFTPNANWYSKFTYF